jgi:hypothetical protein
MIEDEYADICHVQTRLKNLPRRNMGALPADEKFHTDGPWSECGGENRLVDTATFLCAERNL